MSENKLHHNARQLKKQLQDAKDDSRSDKKTHIQVPGIGQGISTAYEQLRNSAEYTEDHLLLQRAARRFYKRNISFHTHKKIDNLGEELIIELTQAGYLENGTISVDVANSISDKSEKYAKVYWDLRKKKVQAETAENWVLDILSAGSADLIDPHNELLVFAYFAYEHYLKLFPKTVFMYKKENESKYEISLYVATHRALLKSDLPRLRSDLVNLYRIDPEDLDNFIQFNENISVIFYDKLTQQLRRAVNKYGAPLRILKQMIEDNPDLPSILDNRTDFLAMYQHQTFNEYKAVKRRLNKGLVKSIVFLLISKALVGIAVEIPYDLITVGVIGYMPLAVNLAFPPFYMASLKIGLRPPTMQNAQALEDYIDKVLYSEDMPLKPALRSFTKSMSTFSKFVYTLLFFIPFLITVIVLSLIGFNIIQMIIFFVFLSTASFLGFRLSQIVRELELVDKDVGIGQVVRDFFYLPFIMVGQWLSGKYAQMNIIGMLLDMLIELPLKTVLRLVRQWILFLNERREQIY